MIIKHKDDCRCKACLGASEVIEPLTDRFYVGEFAFFAQSVYMDEGGVWWVVYDLWYDDNYLIAKETRALVVDWNHLIRTELPELYDETR